MIPRSYRDYGMVSFGNMELSNLHHMNPELVIVMLLMNSASPHGRRLAQRLATEDPYNVNIEPDADTINVNAQIAHVYLKSMGIRMVFKKTLVELIQPAWFTPGMLYNGKNTCTNADGYQYPGWFMTEQEKALQNNCLIPAEYNEYKDPAHFIPGSIIQRKERRNVR